MQIFIDTVYRYISMHIMYSIMFISKHKSIEDKAYATLKAFGFYLVYCTTDISVTIWG